MFEQKVVLVTGGSSGIGQAVCIRLAAYGAKVIVHYSNSKAGAEYTLNCIREQGGEGYIVQADVSSEEEVKHMIVLAMQRYGELHYVVNNAGATEQWPLEDLDGIPDEVWDRLFAVNVKGMFYVAKAARAYLIQQADSAIVNVGSVAGTTGIGSSLPYAVSKAAVHGLTKSLAFALAPHVRVNAIAPGAVDTRWWAGHEEKMRRLSGDMLLKRISTPEDIAESICAMLVQQSLTGQIITIDNGQTMA